MYGDFLDDTPIRSQSNDLLNRSSFAKKIGNAILNMNAKNGLCIGLFGPWGSGKTSILNMMEEEISLYQAEQSLEPIILNFNPWNYSSKEELLHQFFIMLGNRFANSKEKNIRKIGKAIKKYGDNAEAIASITGFNALSLFKASGEAIEKLANTGSVLNDIDLSEQKEAIIERLKKKNQKIIVVIDDIDRLPDSQIRLIFQLVNSVAKFPNTIYVLSFDRKIVINALTGIQGGDGNDFLDKIIQVPIQIPSIQKGELNKILFKKLDDIRNIYQFRFEQEEQQYFHFVFQECINGHFSTLRDINRLINALHTKCIVIGNEINFADLVALTFIENKYPELYYWISSNREKLTGSEQYLYRYIGNKNIQSIVDKNNEEIKKRFPENGILYCRMLSLLFPIWSQHKNLYGVLTASEMHRAQRLGHSEFIDRYFCLGLPDNEISRNLVDRMFFDMDEEQLSDAFDDIIKNFSCKYFLNELDPVLDGLKEDRKILIAKMLIRKSSMFREETRSSIYELSNFQHAYFQILGLLNSLNEEKAYRLLQEEISNANANSIQVLSVILNSKEMAYEKNSNNNSDNSDNTQLVTQEHLSKCKQLYSEKIKEIVKNVDLFQMEHVGVILHLFEKVDLQGFADYIKTLNPIQNLKYLNQFATLNDIHKIWDFENDYNKCIEDEIILSSYKHCLEDGSFWTLSSDEQLASIAFSLWKENEERLDKSVKHDDVMQKQSELFAKYKINSIQNS